eukprot:m.1177451 g.1177451  ORF g.1177451 m.1177451 type:complete len:186 (-) comp24524_c0_seq19:130-687(-)
METLHIPRSHSLEPVSGKAAQSLAVHPQTLASLGIASGHADCSPLHTLSSVHSDAARHCVLLAPDVNVPASSHAKFMDCPPHAFAITNTHTFAFHTHAFATHTHHSLSLTHIHSLFTHARIHHQSRLLSRVSNAIILTHTHVDGTFGVSRDQEILTDVTQHLCSNVVRPCRLAPLHAVKLGSKPS